MMFKMNQLAVGLFLFLSSLFSCQQKGDFKSMNVDDFDNLIQNEDIKFIKKRNYLLFLLAGKTIYYSERRK